MLAVKQRRFVEVKKLNLCLLLKSLFKLLREKICCTPQICGISIRFAMLEAAATMADENCLAVWPAAAARTPAAASSIRCLRLD